MLKRLPGHDSDVTGLAWSTGDRYLASVSLDSVVMIWDGFTLGNRFEVSLYRVLLSLQTEFRSWISIPALLRVYVGTQLENF